MPTQAPAPPQALALALAGMRQGVDLPCQAEMSGEGTYLIEFVPEADRPLLLAYLDGLLTAGGASDEALVPLFAHLGTDPRRFEGRSAREILEGLRAALRRDANEHG